VIVAFNQGSKRVPLNGHNPRSFVWQSFLALLPSGSLAVIGLGRLFA